MNDIAIKVKSLSKLHEICSMPSAFHWGLPRAIHGSDSGAYFTGASSMKMPTTLVISQRIQPCAQTFTHKKSEERSARMSRNISLRKTVTSAGH